MRYNSYRGRSPSRTSTYRVRSNRHPRVKQAIDPSRFIKKASTKAEDAYAARHNFSDFPLAPELQAAITKLGFSVPSPIQDQAIPHALEGKDLIGVANTGTGKTAAFLIPLVNKLLGNPKQQVLIMAPTRELALQIQDDLRKLTTGMRLYSTLCIGGTPIYRQIADLNRQPHFVIGTPGRLKDLLERKRLQTQHCYSVVLDEVDRMVDMGFINDMRAILGQLPRERQSFFLTATITPAVKTIIETFSHNPVTIMVKTGETAENVEQDIIRVLVGENKTDKLHELLTQPTIEKVLIFGETKRGVERLSQDLIARGHRTVSIHGDKSQGQRQHALRQFRSNDATVMIATDVAARGLDIKDISHVINYDTPQTYDDYVHRIGRAGRAGALGYAFTFIN